MCTIFVFIFKWLFSYYFFEDDISIKIIFDSPKDALDAFNIDRYEFGLPYINFHPTQGIVQNMLAMKFMGIMIHFTEEDTINNLKKI